MSDLHARIDHDFALHPPRSAEVAATLDTLRAETRKLAHLYADLGTPSRELSLAVTKLEEAGMHAVASVVRYQPDTEPVAQVDTLGDDPQTRIHGGAGQ